MPSLRSSFIALSLLCSIGAAACGSSPPPSTSPPGPGCPLLVIADDDPTNASACEDRLSFAVEKMLDVAERANGECTQDDQCAVVSNDTQCHAFCQAPILRANVDEYERAKQAINERACTGYMEDGCLYITTDCVGGERAICEQGRCSMAPGAEAG